MQVVKLKGLFISDDIIPNLRKTYGVFEPQMVKNFRQRASTPNKNLLWKRMSVRRTYAHFWYEMSNLRTKGFIRYFLYSEKIIQLFVRKGQLPASQGKMKKETKGQSAEIQLIRPSLSPIQTAPFLKKRGDSRETPAWYRDRNRLPFCFLHGTFLTIHCTILLLSFN